MRLAQLKLSPDNFFWFLGSSIVLNEKIPESNLVDIDSLTREEQKLIDASVQRREVVLLDVYGNKVGSLKEIAIVNGELAVSIDDEDSVEEDQYPDIVSVTCDDDDEEEYVLDEDLEEEAEIILDQNGNTARKTIRNLATNNEAKDLLLIMKNIESHNKCRNGVLKTIEEKLQEFKNE